MLSRTRRCLTVIAYLSLMLCAVPTLHAFEPVTALDDGFASPGASSSIESAMTFPGVEPFIGRPYAALAWQEPFGMRELAITTTHAGIGFGRFGVSAAFSGSGFDLYGDEIIKAGLAYAPVEHLGIGFRISRTAVRISGFGNASAVSIDAGVVYRPFETVWFALAAENLSGAELGESHEPLDGALRCTASWSAIDRVNLITGVCDTPRFDPSFHGGFTVAVAPQLTVGALGDNEPDRIEMLAAITLGGLRFAWRGSYHRDLGMSHGCSLIWGGTEDTAATR